MSNSIQGSISRVKKTHLKSDSISGGGVGGDSNSSSGFFEP